MTGWRPDNTATARAELAGQYTLRRLGHELVTHLPSLVRGASRFLPDLLGDERLALSTRVAVQLRLSRMLGCPVCQSFFRLAGPFSGLDPRAMDSAVEGQPEGLSAEAYGAVAWIEAAIAAGGNEPGIPPAGVDLSAKQREHLVYVARLELVVHSAGLIFLPRHLIVRALGETEG